MEAGRLDRRVVIQKKVVVQDTFGQETITWTTVCTLWGEVLPLTGREFLEGRQETAEVSTRIRVRYYQGIEPEYRASVVVDGTTIVYNILAVLHLGTARRELQLMCREIDE